MVMVLIQITMLMTTIYCNDIENDTVKKVTMTMMRIMVMTIKKMTMTTMMMIVMSRNRTTITTVRKTV